MKYIFVFLILLIFFNAVSAQSAISKTDLDDLVKRGRETNSDAVIVIQDGKVLVEEYYGKPKGAVYIASAGKSLTALAIGKLLDEGKIKSLDQPVSDFYPEWLQGRKQKITVRMLLNHTSGLQNVLNASVELERKFPPVNAVKLAIAAELSDAPGAVYSYNNKAVALLGGIIEKASGKRMDKYVEEAFYAAMEIKNFDWVRDEDGNPVAYGAFYLEPQDFAKFGTLMLNKGTYQGKRILSESFVDEALKPGQNLFAACGLLWWRYPRFTKRLIDGEKMSELQKANVSGEFLQKLRALQDITYQSNDEFYAAMEKTFGKDWSAQVDKVLEGKNVTLAKRIFSDDIVAYYASGFRGNYLIIVPQAKIVAIRVARNDADYNYETDLFADFMKRIVGLTEKDVSAPPVL